ncbi:hypothetical protein GCM10011494_39980 [Novosphingobium endophyticum]|uniref:Uncharacterized protein n=1 Tax=Novosphingobium endophyticum TaxID=1955250 RepID=A0A916TYS8_9SPHN|nr:hypothetical protein [Novosphingobium endophyticum]GGC17118.1 hypothetical protein GCM10011494_39980 [Novosphingobium endophyticum]
MASRIAPLDGARLKLSGDVETVIALSPGALREGFAIAISDGTLVRGRYDSARQDCRFAVAIEGAGIASIGRCAQGDRLDLAWRIEWISLAAGSHALCPADDPEGAGQAQLMLEIGGRTEGRQAA